MSRCFPYTPLNYKKKDVSLVGSIKTLQNGRGNTKQRKEPSQHTNGKPSKKRSRVECGNLDSSEHKSKKRMEAEKKTNPNGSSGVPRKNYCEHLERSDLSEEHNLPVFVLNHCSSKPSTPKSSKKNAVQAADLNEKRPSMVLRIKLPLKKHNDPQPVSTCKVLCSSAQLSISSKRQVVVRESTPQPEPQFLVSEEPCFSRRTAETHVIIEEPCFSGRTAETHVIIEAEPSNWRHRQSHGHRIRKSERRFHELILNWRPPPLQLNEEENLDWLFASKRKDGEFGVQISKAPISKPRDCLVPTDSLQPRACYLPEFDMYQLPYVIPF